MKKTKKLNINKLIISKLNNPSLIYGRTASDCQATGDTQGETIISKVDTKCGGTRPTQPTKD